MSLYDYERSKEISREPFYALIMAAMRTADDDNSAKLREAFPGVWVELQARYNAPGGRLPEEGEETIDADDLRDSEPALCEQCQSEDPMTYDAEDKVFYCSECGYAHLVEGP